MLALAAISLLAGCVGDIGGGDLPGEPPTDSGGQSGPLYPYVTFGTHCDASGEHEYLVLSTQPGCGAHLGAFGALDPARFVRIQIDGATGARAPATLCVEGTCAATELGVQFDGANGEWWASVDGVEHREGFTAERCDYDAYSLTGGHTPVRDLPMREVALYQGVKVVLARDGNAVTPNAPIVAGRDGLLRLFVDPAITWSPRELIARVTLGDGEPLEARAMVRAPSRDDDLGSTLNIPIPGDRLTPDVSISVGIYELERSCGGPQDGGSARFPAEGTTTLAARSMGGTFRVVLVPVRYLADGSARLPDLSEENIGAFRDRMHVLFPVEDVEITVRSTPMDWDGETGADGRGWSALLEQCMTLRSRDNPAPDTYYYCFFSPANTVFDFCGQGCVAGLGPVPGPEEEFYRASIGLGYRGMEDTFVHEVGHSLGRPHAPCGGPAQIDPGYPYSNGGIGSWGYDVLTGRLKDPGQYSDLLGYCNDTWISDYNYRLIFDRLREVRGTSAAYVSGATVRYATVVVDVDGSLSWGAETERVVPPSGERIAATWSSAGGVTSSTDAIFVAVSHLAGGIVYVPIAEGAERLELAGIGALAR